MIGRNGSSFRFGRGWLLPIARRLGVRQNLLQRLPAEAVLLAGGTLAQFVRQHLPTNFFPKLHIGSHS